MRYFKFLLFFFCCLSVSGQDLTFYSLGLKQVSINPADMQKQKFTIGLPALSSWRMEYNNNGFTYKDFYKKRSDDSVVIDVNNLTSVLQKNNYLSTSLAGVLFHFVYRSKNNQFSFSVSERLDVDFSFPKELFNLINKGNAAYIGQTVDLKQLALDAVHYREYFFGYARQVNNKLSVGGRIKYLYGMDNIQTINNNTSLYTAPDDYALKFNADFRVNTSSILNDDNIEVGEYLFGMQSRGFGMDLSANLLLDDKWSFSLMLLDFGKINWRTAVKNYTTSAGEYEFRGIDISGFVTDSTDQLKDVLDSIGNSFKSVETNETYSTYLPYRVYGSAAYRFNEHSALNGIVQLRHGAGRMHLATTLAFNHSFSKLFRIAISNSVIYSKFINPGIAFNFNPGSFNVFFATDNVIGFFDPLSNYRSDLKAGIFFSW